MSAAALPEPLGGASPAEVSLSRAPLVRVLAQVIFPGILKIDSKDAVADLQEQIRGDYPLFEQQASRQVHLQVGVGEPIVRQEPANLWRFIDAEKNWRVSLTTSFCTLECDRYLSRDDFISRWSGVLTAIERSFNPRIVQRTGLRYINQVKGEQLKSIEDLVRPGILGVATPNMRQHILHHLTEATLAIEEGEMLLRWGIMPANATIDPGTLNPIPEKSWILDIDVYSNVQRPFTSQELASSFRALAEREYSVFRFVTTERFLQTYGAAT
jgi:uncharacterized protein (TIGR04255 family)